MLMTKTSTRNALWGFVNLLNGENSFYQNFRLKNFWKDLEKRTIFIVHVICKRWLLGELWSSKIQNGRNLIEGKVLKGDHWPACFARKGLLMVAAKETVQAIWPLRWNQANRINGRARSWSLKKQWRINKMVSIWKVIQLWLALLNISEHLIHLKQENVFIAYKLAWLLDCHLYLMPKSG